MEIEKAILKIGHMRGVTLSYHPMGGWDCRITTFEHTCNPKTNYHETWCNGQCSSVMGLPTAQEAIQAALDKAHINIDIRS